MTTSSNLNQSGESEELRPKLLALLKGGQVINNTTDHNERSVLEMLYGEKADQIEELIHQRELEAIERWKYENEAKIEIAAKVAALNKLILGAGEYHDDPHEYVIRLSDARNYRLELSQFDLSQPIYKEKRNDQ